VESFDPEALRRTRQRVGLSQAAVADRLGIARTNYVAYETGRRRPTSPVLVAMARIVEAAPSDLTTVEPSRASLRDLRQWAGLEHVDVARALGNTSATSYGHVERGSQSLPSRHVDRVAELFGVTVEQLHAALGVTT